MMETIRVSFYDFERDTLLPHRIRQRWRAQLCPIILRDVQQGLFGTHRYNLSSYTAVYNVILGEGSLSRIHADLQSFAANDRHTSSLRELLANTNVWLSFEAIRSDEVVRYSMFRRPHFSNVLNNLHTYSSCVI